MKHMGIDGLPRIDLPEGVMNEEYLLLMLHMNKGDLEKAPVLEFCVRIWW